MEENSGHISQLLQKFLFGQLTDVEKLQFEEWLQANDQNRQLLESFRKAKNIEQDLAIVKQLDANRAWEKLNNKGKKPNHKWFIGIAASLLLLASFFYLWQNYHLRTDDTIHTSASYLVQDVEPARSGAILQLSNGEKIALNDKTSKTYDSNKTFVGNGRELVIKNNKSQRESRLNSLIVPRASFYKITLSDGTRVWVNAQSNLKFPAQFSENERRVSLEGEAYFEVAHDAKKPFFVESKAGEIKVLGTHFNVFAYHDDIRATLVEGKVEVRQHENKLELNPGEFASLSKNNMIKGSADIQQDLAWHNNEFYFKKETIVNIAHQLSRWYDLDVKFRGNVQLNKEYSGSIQRDVKLSQVLEMLSYVSNLRFEIHGKELIIENKS
ncbi:MAG: FecR family protein [Sphingobacterium sp.]|jgi:ferric-dicitrate binding protein FerR (iron transport regulator)|uniref:FecR family protein n=1 Tax=Sphingobacterium sp. TaxID=341027 RepID=UPI00281D84A5|nr:FecR family protein [Sphingobacterium sp.]MDR0266263.1 FecR family protein [Sphingobacterium sp.]